MFDSFLLCFLPLFVAVDAVGVLPLFVSLTEGLNPARRRSVILQSVVTAVVVALLFVLIGRAVLRVLGITVDDFMIAGGVLLFVLSMRDLLAAGTPHRHPDTESLGVVPIGVPLITGPAVLTTSLLLLGEHGLPATCLALVINIGLAGLVFLLADALFRVLGKAGSKAVSKVASLLLAAIAVMMVRKGIVHLILTAGSS